MSESEKYFKSFRDNTIGSDSCYTGPFGEKKIIYCDWIGSGRLYGPIEDKLRDSIGPFVANTHTETSETGSRMTWAYHHAQKIIKKRVNAGPGDVLITAGSGMTTVIAKLQRMLGLKCASAFHGSGSKKSELPVVFITHMEHHSNQTSWYETIADVVVLEPDDNMLVNPENLRRELKKYHDRKFKIGAFTACSNVTGIETPYHQLAKIMHENDGICFIDFAASAPYVQIDMHPADPMEKLDGIYFSPHKFLGGPGSSGVLVFDSQLYSSKVPDNPGGGTVDWTNRWGEYKYVDDIEVREDGGTPGFLQAMKIALAMELKEEMGVDNIGRREAEITERMIAGLGEIKGLHLLADNVEKKLPVFSFYIENIHYNLIVKLLSDRYGIQARGGCACAGTYGHFLLKVSYDQSHTITEMIDHGDLSSKPGWVRMSFHPTTTNDEIDLILQALNEISAMSQEWGKEYNYNSRKNEFVHKSQPENHDENVVGGWFKL